MCVEFHWVLSIIHSPDFDSSSQPHIRFYCGDESVVGSRAEKQRIDVPLAALALSRNEIIVS